MVHRDDPGGLIAISQPAHAWVAGQLARHWGNAVFGEVAPREEVCLAAELHDIGFLEWERAPTLDADTGRPHHFMNMPTRPHLALWAQGVQHLLSFSRYVALMGSRHVTYLCRHKKPSHNPRDAQAVEDFLDQQQALQSELLSELAEDPAYGGHTTPEALERNTRLIATWDWVSLQLCLGLPAGRAMTVTQVPAVQGPTTLQLQPAAHNPLHITVRPWPFRTGDVPLVCDGRRLPGTFGNEALLRAGMRRAPTTTLRITLRPD
ncbi:MAG: DUF3891 family protein [Verrucomicrobia bacterium]|nr:DUF3891 family protein [Verrucomicrobiota bacterium]